MKKLMCLFALVGLMFGCAHDHSTGAASDQNQMSSGASPTAPAKANSGTQQ